MAREAGLPERLISTVSSAGAGRSPKSGAIYVEKVEDTCRELGVGEVVTVIGRYWSLDREENWTGSRKPIGRSSTEKGRPVGNFFGRNS